MTGHVRHFLEHYLPPHPRRELREIFFSTAILDFATGAVMLFEPIYLRSVGFSIVQILLFYLAVYIAYFFLLPIGGRICRRHGFEHSILYSSPFLILYYIAFFAVDFHPALLFVAGVALLVQKILYWPGYHANFAAWSGDGERGRELSSRSAIAASASVLAPLFGGLVIATLGFRWLFLIIAGLILLSNVPLWRTPELFEPRPFPYGDAFKNLLARANRRLALASFGFGEELFALALWPIYIVAFIPNLLSLGAVVSLATLANILVAFKVGRICDEEGRGGVLKSGSFFTAASWAFRPFVTGPFGVFLSDAFYRASRNMVNVPLVASVYEDGRKGEKVMETVVAFEMALSLGKASAAAIGIAVFMLAPDPWAATFFIGALFALLYGVSKSGKVEK